MSEVTPVLFLLWQVKMSAVKQAYCTGRSPQTIIFNKILKGNCTTREGKMINKVLHLQTWRTQRMKWINIILCTDHSEQGHLQGCMIADSPMHSVMEDICLNPNKSMNFLDQRFLLWQLMLEACHWARCAAVWGEVWKGSPGQLSCWII